MKWVFVIGGLAMVVIGGIGKYVDMTKFKDDFISGTTPWYTVFITGIIAIILGLSFDWIMSLDGEEEEEGEETPDEEDGPEEPEAEKPDETEEEGEEAEEEPEEPKDDAPGDEPAADAADDDGDK